MRPSGVNLHGCKKIWHRSSACSLLTEIEGSDILVRVWLAASRMVGQLYTRRQTRVSNRSWNTVPICTTSFAGRARCMFRLLTVGPCHTGHSTGWQGRIPSMFGSPSEQFSGVLQKTGCERDCMVQLCSDARKLGSNRLSAACGSRSSVATPSPEPVCMASLQWWRDTGPNV